MDTIIALVLIAALVWGTPVEAQEGPQRVAIPAADGLMLAGDFYPAVGELAPAVLVFDWELADQNWAGLIPQLRAAGYAVLVISMRGYGETRGAINWSKADGDTAAWLAWLRGQAGIDPARISLIGGSVGSNMALRGMAFDPQVVTAVALSPGLNYGGATTEDALAGIGDRPVLMAVSHADSYSAHTVKVLTGLAVGETFSRFYGRSGHAMEMLGNEAELAPLIVEWVGRSAVRPDCQSIVRG